jgi:hypothetical protein
MRHPDPDILKKWRALVATPVPKVCASCQHYGVDGLCVAWFKEPPADFAATDGACPQWEEECPF